MAPNHVQRDNKCEMTTNHILLEKIQALRDLVDERDRLYKERDDARRTAVDAALAAVKEQTKASFDASEKAIVKAEEAQKAYNTSHNDLSRKLEDQNKATMPRMETESRFHTLEEKTNEIRGRTAASKDAWGYLLGAAGLIVGAIAVIAAMFK